MNSPKWKYKPSEPFSINPEVEALTKLKALKNSMRDPVGEKSLTSAAIKLEKDPEKRR